MIVNIETAEGIVNEGLSNRKQMFKQLKQVIDIVEKRRKTIAQYLLVVDRIESQYQEKKHYLEKLISQLNDRDQSLNKGLNKIGSQQKELEQRQVRIEQDLKQMRITAERYLEKKKKSEQYYYSVISIPILSAQSKNKYIKARNKYCQAEQQISEIRQSLEKCRDHLKLISKTISTQYTEQDQLSVQRRGSLDTIESSVQQLDYLKQGCEFWSGFDSYQAQVVLESAIYLLNMDYNQTVKNESLDVHQVWQKTFQLACFEYGDRELYGDTRWNVDTLEINYQCAMCQTTQTGWPTVINSIELVCDICSTTLIDPERSKPLPSIPSHSRIKTLFSSLFHHHTKINPM
ncbi:hypothetical protein MFLAVUS_007003 [Mucor flavus]|uniref:Uncharacterized protein n=1 Tax=Mucor flavus TaxID=439312 RepID=A0ABP9Z342_9FUNG